MGQLSVDIDFYVPTKWDLVTTRKRTTSTPPLSNVQPIPPSRGAVVMVAICTYVCGSELHFSERATLETDFFWDWCIHNEAIINACSFRSTKREILACPFFQLKSCDRWLGARVWLLTCRHFKLSRYNLSKVPSTTQGTAKERFVWVGEFMVHSPVTAHPQLHYFLCEYIQSYVCLYACIKNCQRCVVGGGKKTFDRTPDKFEWGRHRQIPVSLSFCSSLICFSGI